MRKNELSINEKNIKKTLIIDALDRRPILFKLINLLNVLNDNYLISIDGDWGIGKTFFIKQLLYLCYENNDPKLFLDDREKECAELLKNKYIPIYYNAWENDDHTDVVESLIYSVLDVYPKYRNDIFKKKQNFSDILKPCLINLVDKGTFGILNKDVFDSIETFEDLTQSIVTTEEKKQNLYKILNMLTGDDTRILLIVDELDRCKPDYAVKVLETLKHFYNYKNVTILVVTNNSQLSQCVKHFYGESFDGYGYLNKMYDTVLSLNTKNIDQYMEKYLDYTKSDYLSNRITRILVKYFKFSLRECNTYINMVNISTKYIQLTNPFDRELFIIYSSFFLPIGLAIKIRDIAEYNRFINGLSDKFLLEITDHILSGEQSQTFSGWLKDLFKSVDGEQLNDKIINCYHSLLNQPEYNYNTYPFRDALSLLGNLVNYENDSNDGY